MKSIGTQRWSELAKQSGFNARVLAAKLNISRWILHRHTKKLYGQSPQTWLNEVRLTLAAEMLKDCDSIKRLAYELGYKTESHFCHQFRRRYRMSPTEFITGNKNTNLIAPAELTSKVLLPDNKCYSQTILPTSNQ